MPIKTSRDPKTGKLTYKYTAPKGGFKKSKRLDAKDLGINVPKTNVKPPKPGTDRFRTQYNTGGRYYDDRKPDPLDFASPRLNFIRSGMSALGLKPGIDRAMDAKQIERLKQYPELRSDQYIQSLKRVADAGATGGFDFDALFSPTDPRVSQTNRGLLQSQDMVLANQADPTSGVLEGGALSDADIINKVGDNVVDAPLVFAADNYADTTLGGIKDAAGTANLDAQINETYPDNTNLFNQRMLNIMTTDGGQTTPSSYTAINPYLAADTRRYEERRVSNPYVTTDNVGNMYLAPTPVVNNRPTGNFNNLPPAERAMSGGLLTTPTFNFDVSPFGGTGFYDNIMLKAIKDSPFGSGIALNPSLTPSIVDTGFLGSRALNPSGTINIGNIGTVTDQFGRELSGQERIDFIVSEFNKLKNQNDALSNFNLGILR